MIPIGQSLRYEYLYLSTIVLIYLKEKQNLITLMRSDSFFQVFCITTVPFTSSFVADQLRSHYLNPFKRTLAVMRKANTDSTHYHYSPFLIDNDAYDTKTALIILNSPIRNPPSPLFDKLWDMANFRICADGGANRLFDATTGNAYYTPDLIRGDLDSLRQDVRDYYSDKRVRIEKDPCQDTNDLDKCLQIVSKEWLEGNGPDHRICMYGAFGGRFDQEMASIQSLYKWKDVFQSKLFLYDDYTSAFLLSEGVNHEIRLPFHGERIPTEADIGDGPTCGLIPMGSKCESIKTTGLKWDLHGDVPLEFGGLVSTSNRLMEAVVTVQATHPLVFTAEIMAGRNI